MKKFHMNFNPYRGWSRSGFNIILKQMMQPDNALVSLYEAYE